MWLQWSALLHVGQFHRGVPTVCCMHVSFSTARRWSHSSRYRYVNNINFTVHLMEHIAGLYPASPCNLLHKLKYSRHPLLRHINFAPFSICCIGCPTLCHYLSTVEQFIISYLISDSFITPWFRNEKGLNSEGRLLERNKIGRWIQQQKGEEERERQIKSHYLIWISRER